MVKGFYYLDTRKRFLFTQRSVPADAVKSWGFDEDATTMGALWRIAIEATALGADDIQIQKMQTRWQMTEEGLIAFAERCGISIEKMKGRDDIRWMAAFRRLPRLAPPQIKYGVGGTPLGAMAQLTQNGAYLQNQAALVPA